MSPVNPSTRKLTSVRTTNSQDLQKAAEDFRYLLNRGYPRRAALELVGNRYQLTSDHRHLLHRGVFSDPDSASRREKIVPAKRIQGKDLVIDGYNVIITIEAGLSARPLVLADDGVIRDISGLSGNFRKTEKTEEALRLIVEVIRRIRPRQTLFLFDAPISMSGNLAHQVRACLEKERLLGDAKAVKVPEKILIGFPGVVATSDTAIIDQSQEVFDLAGHIIRSIHPPNLICWRGERGGRTKC
ncbi:MAG: DUF434 domain-containing protein [Syntrophaceae bacterium]|nr:DUF434 domain-containing protein [Syntrophaceae bacterium]